ncbi:MAG: exodeoxyribonuclease VII small subunit [Hungatella sp.]
MEKTIEQTFEELENLVGTMESGHSSLEESFACYEIGMKLVKECSKNDQVEKKIMILTEEGGDDHES